MVLEKTRFQSLRLGLEHLSLGLLVDFGHKISVFIK